MAVYPGNTAKPVHFDAPLDPDDNQGQGSDYLFDWADWLGTDTISTHAQEYPDGGITEGSVVLMPGQTGIVVWVTPAVDARPGQDYRVRSRIVTTAGRSQTRTGIIRVQEK